ncbi:hypothetical protein, partial [Elioraea sp.]|uniref:hypothetical protein n=1 Tax=Elioraea sp. TaxID=2185103 RepID=UPI003F6F6730
MKKLEYSYKQTRQASTLLSLCLSELEASEVLVERELFREAIVHMYFCSFYVSQALLAKHVGKKASEPIREEVESFESAVIRCVSRRFAEA